MTLGVAAALCVAAERPAAADLKLHLETYNIEKVGSPGTELEFAL